MNEFQISPRLEIDLAKIQHNCARLTEQLGALGVSVMGVTKATLGCYPIAQAMLLGGVTGIGESRIENIRKMREAGIVAEFTLLRSPQISRVEEVVKYADISLNTEIQVIERLSEAAEQAGRIHRVLLMLELGDLREGIPLHNVDEAVCRCLALPNIQLEGIGTNLTCLSGVMPDGANMERLNSTVKRINKQYSLALHCISGGNSATLNWLFSSPDIGSINNVRLGEAILLGCETLDRQLIPGLYGDAFHLVAEVIESKVKPSVPIGEVVQNAFGQVPKFIQRGEVSRSILAIGQQDVPVSGLSAINSELQIIGASSDHLVVDSTHCPLAIGAQVKFNLNYAGILAAMTSPFVEKVFK